MSRLYFSTGVLIVALLVSLIQGVKLVRGEPKAFAIEPWKVKGAPNAPVFLVEFSDYSCPFCSMMDATLKELLAAFPNDLKLVFKHYPLNSHPRALPAAEAAECAGDQKKFWEYHDRLFERVEDWHKVEDKELNKRLTYYAKELDLNAETFEKCLESGSKKAVVLANREEGQHVYVSGTPTLLLNGKRVVIKNKLEDLKKIIEEEIRKAKK